MVIENGRYIERHHRLFSKGTSYRRANRYFFISCRKTIDENRNLTFSLPKDDKNMPTFIGKPYTIAWNGSPPHMLPPDIPVWYRWLKLYNSFIVKLYYDVLLGGPFLTEEQRADSFQRMWAYNISKRADVLIETSSEVWIIEVSQFPGIRAIGQLQVYQTLWIEDPKIIKPERLILVCETIDNDIGAAAGKFGIQVYMV